VRRAAKEGRAAPQQTAAQSREIARMAATMQAFLQPQRKQQPATKSGTGNVTAHLIAESGSGCDRGLGDLRPSASGRGGDAVGRGAWGNDATEAEEAHPSGRAREDAGKALARRLGLHSSSSSGESDGGRAALSEGGAWADVLADDGASTPRETRAAGVDPMGLRSPGKRGRVPAAKAHSSPQPPESRSAEEDGGRTAAVVVLGSPEKRRRMPVSADAAPERHGSGPAEPSDPGRAAGQERAAPGRQQATAEFSIRRRPALPAAGGRGRGRRPAAAAGTLQIERFLQKQPASCRAGAAGEAQRSSKESRAAGAAEKCTPSRGVGDPSSPESVVDLTQSASPLRGAREGNASAARQSGSRKPVAAVLRSPDGRCSVEREIEELLQSRGTQPRPCAAEQTAHLRVGRHFDFVTPSTEGDIVVDLLTPPSSQQAGE
jgi:hypothetical protein